MDEIFVSNVLSLSTNMTIEAAILVSSNLLIAHCQEIHQSHPESLKKFLLFRFFELFFSQIKIFQEKTASNVSLCDTILYDHKVKYRIVN